MGACGSTSSSTARYPVTHAGAVQNVQEGTVVSTRVVKIDGRATNMGRLVGAGIGTAVGSVTVPYESETRIYESEPGVISIDGTDNRAQNRAAMAVGGAVGMVVGQEVEKMITAKKAQELTIALDQGETVVVVQEYREPEFYEDERVKVYTTRSGDSVVYHAGENPGLDPETNAYLIDETVEDSDEFETVTW